MSGADKVGTVVSLAVTVVAPIVVLATARRAPDRIDDHLAPTTALHPELA
jgi:hypothetical protein